MDRARPTLMSGTGVQRRWDVFRRDRDKDVYADSSCCVAHHEAGRRNGAGGSSPDSGLRSGRSSVRCIAHNNVGTTDLYRQICKAWVAACIEVNKRSAEVVCKRDPLCAPVPDVFRRQVFVPPDELASSLNVQTGCDAHRRNLMYVCSYAYLRGFAIKTLLWCDGAASHWSVSPTETMRGMHVIWCARLPSEQRALRASPISGCSKAAACWEDGAQPSEGQD